MVRCLVLSGQQFSDTNESGNEQRDDRGQQSLLGDQSDDDVGDNDKGG